MSPKRVLYVEDNLQNKRLVRKVLKSKGYEVLEAEDGVTGVEMARSMVPDLILMDINIPGIDGMEATARIKSAPETKHVPVVALTANAMRGDRERVMAAGCDEYLDKPVHNAKLIATVQRFIGSADAGVAPSPSEATLQADRVPQSAEHPAKDDSAASSDAQPQRADGSDALSMDAPVVSGAIAPAAPLKLADQVPVTSMEG
jgi:two-component system cell cycle response regulator DivK